jgi:hypothetical protein
MKHLSPLRRTIGLVLIMVGGFWAALSLGFLEESFMTGQTFYTVLGAILVVAGVLVLVVKPKGSAEKDAPAPDDDAPADAST